MRAGTMGVEIEAAALSSRGAGEGRQRSVANDQRAAFKSATYRVTATAGETTRRPTRIDFLGTSSRSRQQAHEDHAAEHLPRLIREM